MKKNKIYLLLLLFVVAEMAVSQSELENLLEQELSDEIIYSSATFKSTRLINCHTIERMQKRNLDFRISHRFGKINDGISNFYGLDNAVTLIGLEYGVTDWLMIGVARTTYKKTVQLFYKLSLFRQSSGGKNFPMSISLHSDIEATTIEFIEEERNNYFSSRLNFSHSLILARKFNDSFSLLLIPTFHHKNLVKNSSYSNDILIFGMGFRQKLTKWVSVNAEFLPVLNISEIDENKRYNTFSIGLDIETGGHVFQLHFSNCPVPIESSFFYGSEHSWREGDVHFGFNISRVFKL